MSFLFCAADKEEHHERHILQPDCPAGMPRTGDGPAGPERPGGRLPERKIWTKPAEGSGADDQFPAVFAAAEGPHASDSAGGCGSIGGDQYTLRGQPDGSGDYFTGGAPECGTGRGAGKQGRGGYSGAARHDGRHQPGAAGRTGDGAAQSRAGAGRCGTAGGRGRCAGGWAAAGVRVTEN